MRKFFDGVRRLVTNRVFSRVLLGYLALTLIMAALCGASYALALRLSREHAADRNALLFENASASINAAYDVVDRFTSDVYKLPQLNRLLHTSSLPSDVTYLLYETVRALPALSDGQGLVENYYVYLPALNAVVAPSQGFVHLEKYYDVYFRIDPEQSFDQWREMLLSISGRSLLGSWRNDSGIFDAVPLSVSVSGAPSSVLLYRIDGERLLRQFSDAFSSVSECAVIADLNGRILGVSGRDEELAAHLAARALPADSGVCTISEKGVQYMLSYTTVGKMGARLMVLIPVSALQAQAHASISGLLNVLVWLLLAGVGMIALLILGGIQPLLSVAEHASSMQPAARGVQAISDMVDSIESRNASLAQKLAEHQQSMRAFCANRLVHGQRSDARAIAAIAADARLPLHGSRFRGVLAEFRRGGAPAEALPPELLSDLLNAYSPRLIFLQMERLNAAAYLLTLDDRSPDELRAFFAPLYERVRARYGMDPLFYVGAPCDSPERIPQSFSSARWLTAFATRDQWLYVDQEGRQNVRLSDVLSSDEEQRLVNGLMTGNLETVNAVLDEIYRHSRIENNLQGFRRQYLYCRLIGILAKCVPDANEAPLPESLMQADVEEFFAWLRPQYARCCELAQSKSTQRSLRMVEDIRQYIEENYADMNLSLNLLASNFGITANYLSGMFKKQFGMNFSAYLEQVRLSHAELLLETRLSIDDVALQTGYANADSFRRAFKRASGMSPSQYRSLAAEKAVGTTNG